MPSTLVHVALAALVAAALLGEEFDGRSLAVVLAAVVVVDLDVFVGWVVLGAHRAAFHTLLWPALAGLALVYDGRNGAGYLRRRWGDRGLRIAWTTVAAVVLAAIGPDATFNGANLLYPLHDQFYAFDGRLVYSDQRGLVQTFVDLQESARGSTQETQFRTGADPNPDPAESDAGAERVFPVATSGLQLLVILTSAVVTTARLSWSRNR